jgi:HEAT repeat protein
VLRIVGMIVLVAAVVVAGGWYYLREHRVHTPTIAETPPSKDPWVEQLYSSNPIEAQAAAKRVEQLGPEALPVIHRILQDPNATPAQVKGAIKACALLGPVAAPAIGEVAEQLPDPTVTADAAMALSFMGPKAFAPLKQSLSSEDAAIRREALRSIGKLKERAPLESMEVVPLLIDAMSDADSSVRAVAATYLGIIHEGGSDAVTALMQGLSDQAPDVRRASATALGSFGSDAEPAIPALRKAASSDPDEDVAREAGVSVVKLTSK